MRKEAPAADAPAPAGKVSRKKFEGSLWSRLRPEAAPVSDFVAGSGAKPAADPPGERPVLKGSLTGPPPVARPADDPAREASAEDKEDETTKGELKGSLLKKRDDG